jgi:hypothetical protein
MRKEETNGQIDFAGNTNVPQTNCSDRVEGEKEAVDERPAKGKRGGAGSANSSFLPHQTAPLSKRLKSPLPMAQ